MNKHFLHLPTTIETLSAQTAETCPDPIRDEYNPLLDDPDLLAAIEEFEEEGIDVFVDLTQTMLDEGYITSDDMPDDEFYATGDLFIQEQLQDGCQAIRVSDNYILVVRVHEDGLLEVVTEGLSSNYVNRNNSEFQDNVDDLFDDMVRDNPDTLQDDTAQFLERLHADMFEETESSTATESAPSSQTANETTQPQPSPSIDLPVAEIGIGAAAVVTIGGIGAAAINKRDSFRYKKDFNASLIEDETRIDMTVSIADLDKTSPLVAVPSEDIPDLVALHQEITEKQGEWEDQRKLAKLQIAAALKGVMPNKQDAIKIARKYQKETEEQRSMLDRFDTEHAAVIEARDALSSRMEATSDELAKAIMLYIKLKTTGLPRKNADAKPYTMTKLSERVVELKNDYEATELLATREGFIMQPTDRLNQLDLSLAELKATLESIPEMHDAATENTETLIAESGRLEVDFSNSVRALTTFKNRYDKANYGSTAADLETLKAQKQETQADISALGKPDTIYDVDELLDITEQIVAIDGGVADFDATEHDINEHIRKVDTIAERIPSQLTTLDEDVDESIEFVSKHAQFIEDDSEEALFALEHTLDGIFQDLDTPKPDYLSLDDRRREFASALKSARAKAEEEHLEMVNLFASIESGLARFDNDAARLLGYERSNSSDIDYQTERDIDDAVESPELPAGQSRQELRDADRLLQQAINVINDAYRDARSDVQRAEAERAAEAARIAREARRERERAAEKRRDRQRSQAAAQRRSTSTRTRRRG